MMLTKENFDYELIDSGLGARVERFGKIVLERPCPQAFGFPKERDREVDGYFIREFGKNEWEHRKGTLPDSWVINVGDKKAELRLSANGQVGIFPEQFKNWKWIESIVQNDTKPDRKILNTFSYTGMSTLFASTDKNEVCHVDGAKSAVSWARKNAELSEMKDHKIRWICDDVLEFMKREVRRGKKYDGIILDPPAFGRGAKKDWKIERDIDALMALVAELLTDEPLFVILTCHAPDHFEAIDFAEMLESLPQFQGSKAEDLDLVIPSEGGNELSSSFGARIKQ